MATALRFKPFRNTASSAVSQFRYFVFNYMHTDLVASSHYAHRTKSDNLFMNTPYHFNREVFESSGGRLNVVGRAGVRVLRLLGLSILSRSLAWLGLGRLGWSDLAGGRPVLGVGCRAIHFRWTCSYILAVHAIRSHQLMHFVTKQPRSHIIGKLIRHTSYLKEIE